MKVVILENWQLRMLELEDKEVKDLKKHNYFVENNDIIFIDKDYKKIQPYIYYLLNKYKYLWVEKITKLILLLSLFFIIIFGWLYFILINSIKWNYKAILDFEKQYIKTIEQVKEEREKEQKEEKQKNKVKIINLENKLKVNENNR